MNIYKVTFTNNETVNILAKNKQEIENIIAFTLCDGNVDRIQAEIKSYQRLYKNGKNGRKLSLAPDFIFRIWLNSI